MTRATSTARGGPVDGCGCGCLLAPLVAFMLFYATVVELGTPRLQSVWVKLGAESEIPMARYRSRFLGVEVGHNVRLTWDRYYELRAALKRGEVAR